MNSPIPSRFGTAGSDKSVVHHRCTHLLKGTFGELGKTPNPTANTYRLIYNPLVLLLQALNLSCTVWGDPTPEVSWLKNEKAFVSDANCTLKFESGKNVSFTISTVSTLDSGKYSIVVKNKYGTETSDVTVSVFIPEEERQPEPEKEDKKKKA